MTRSDLIAVHALGAASPAEAGVVEHAASDPHSVIGGELGRYREVVVALDDLMGEAAGDPGDLIWERIERRLG